MGLFDLVVVRWGWYDMGVGLMWVFLFGGGLGLGGLFVVLGLDLLFCCVWVLDL